MSMMLPPDAGAPPPGIAPQGMPPPGMPPPGGPPPDMGGGGGDPMAILQALLQGGGGGAPPGGDPMAALGGGGDPLAALGGGGGGPGAGGGDSPDAEGPPAIGDWSPTDHIRAAIKHLMMAMTSSGDEGQTHGITKGMAALQGILAGDQKNQKVLANAGG